MFFFPLRPLPSSHHPPTPNHHHPPLTQMNPDGSRCCSFVVKNPDHVSSDEMSVHRPGANHNGQCFRREDLLRTLVHVSEMHCSKTRVCPSGGWFPTRNKTEPTLGCFPGPASCSASELMTSEVSGAWPTLMTANPRRPRRPKLLVPTRLLLPRVYAAWA